MNDRRLRYTDSGVISLGSIESLPLTSVPSFATQESNRQGGDESILPMSIARPSCRATGRPSLLRSPNTPRSRCLFLVASDHEHGRSLRGPAERKAIRMPFGETGFSIRCNHGRGID